ncbi:alpha/beta fold hydrolase [Gordonia sp. NB41Y]|uniref:alpha/beta hydrolase family protein n=1 Tax=Gordonia sp. NB41Y TaxID=875808 RepID=UPI0002BE7BC5|nr:alpha/beta fold hydrolase [Gordonia sp. NB41Y]EMP12778.1 alpha/beta hydrolase [Gordonia sp. NB41Y]WLP88592.1 alpha/beta fold hydrolase [Gordonia sp. NB41Y]
MSGNRFEYDRIPYLIVFDDTSAYRDTYGGVTESVVLESYLLKPKGIDSDTVVVFMHPIGGGAYLPMTNALPRAGHHVIYCNSRYRGVDSALIMEKVVADLGACVRDAKERLGYRNVVLAGWSGGGALSLYYQQQAQYSTVTATPAGEPPDLTRLDLPAADGLMLLAAHVSRHGTLTEWMDPSIIDETDPAQRDPELDLYNPDNPNQPPYTEEFLTRYRSAQVDRNRRITGWVKEQLADLRDSGEPLMERGFIVHGTMADPRWLDLTQDPNDREPGCYLGDPRVVNMGPVGLARFTTLRSWLSQWSIDDANGDGPRCAADLAVPALVIGNSADNACTPSHTHRLFDGIGHPDKTLHTIDGATHYYSGREQIPHLHRAVEVITDWLGERSWTGV